MAPWTDRNGACTGNDRTPALALPYPVSGDRSVSGVAITSHRFSFTRQSALLDVRWRPAPVLALLVGYAWDGWERNQREAAETGEHTPRFVADFAPFTFLGLRGTYSRGCRRGEWPEDEHAPGSELPSLRRSDLADRDRERVDLTAELFPADAVSLAFSYGRTHDDYPDSSHGLQANDSRRAELDLSWSPSQRLTGALTAGRETYRPRQRSRYRVPPAQLDNESYDWVARSDDVVRSRGLALTATPVPRTLDVDHPHRLLPAPDPGHATPAILSGDPGMHARERRRQAGVPVPSAAWPGT